MKTAALHGDRFKTNLYMWILFMSFISQCATTLQADRSLRKIKAEHQYLGSHGIGIGGIACRDTDWRIDHEGARRALQLSDNLLRCIQLLQQIEKRKSIDRTQTSYGWKHLVERLLTTVHGEHVYISNGEFIAAALIAGFKIRPLEHGGPNCFLNLSRRSLQKLAGRYINLRQTPLH